MCSCLTHLAYGLAGVVGITGMIAVFYGGKMLIKHIDLRRRWPSVYKDQNIVSSFKESVAGRFARPFNPRG